MYKRGQLSIFVIIAILLVAGIFLALYLTGTIFKESVPREEIEAFNEGVRGIKVFVSDCVGQVGEEGLLLIGQQGGYYTLPEASIDSIPYYYFEGQNVMPSKSKIEEEVSSYMNDKLSGCATIQNFEEQGFSINEKAVDTKTTILQDKVILDVKWPVVVSKASLKATLSSTRKEFLIRIGRIYDISKEITEKQVEDPGRICLSCITLLASENNLKIDMDPSIEEKSFAYSIEDGEYEFKFAHKYAV